MFKFSTVFALFVAFLFVYIFWPLYHAISHSINFVQ